MYLAGIFAMSNFRQPMLKNHQPPVPRSSVCNSSPDSNRIKLLVRVAARNDGTRIASFRQSLHSRIQMVKIQSDYEFKEFYCFRGLR